MTKLRIITKNKNKEYGTSLRYKTHEQPIRPKTDGRYIIGNTSLLEEN